MARQIVRALVYLLAIGFGYLLLERVFASEGQVVSERNVPLIGRSDFQYAFVISSDHVYFSLVKTCDEVVLDGL